MAIIGIVLLLAGCGCGYGAYKMSPYTASPITGPAGGLAMNNMASPAYGVPIGTAEPVANQPGASNTIPVATAIPVANPTGYYPQPGE